MLNIMPNCASSFPFQLHPLAAALLVCSLTPVFSQFTHAEAPQHTEKQDIDKHSIKSSSGEKPDQASDATISSNAAQEFFNQYYLSREDIQKLPVDQQRHVPVSCRGTWITPIDVKVKAVEPEQATSVITADYSYYDPQTGSELSGNVKIDQPGRSIQADKVTLDQSQTIATAQGHVQLMDAGLLSQSDRAVYNLNHETGQVANSVFISEAQRAHGKAALINREGNGITRFENASYSTCEPDNKLVWQLRAKEIELNENNGRGITRGTTLYIKDVPVLSVPYFNFPIDDRRTSGFLVPTTGYTNDGGLQLAVPYYFNLAPNYDLTLAPRLLSRRGLMAEGEFRYLTENYGAGQLSGGYLPSDDLFNEDRKAGSYQHAWQIDPSWRTTIDLNYVSDKDYFTDLGTDPSSQNILNQERTWTVYYDNDIPGLSGLFRVQSFQTVDKETADVDKPYARLPQLLLNYRGGSALGLQYDAQNDTAYFKKSISDGSALEASGTRIYNRLASSYNWRNQWGYARPELSLRSVNTFYDQDSQSSQSLGNDDRQRSAVVPQFSFDSSAVFEREGHFLQSITPRFFYAYAPYRDQSNYPNFDTTTASLNFDQLFSPYRFYGHDRLEDNNFASLGLTYRMFDTIGLERLRLGIGESYYFSDRKVRLNDADPIATAKSSGPAIGFGSQLSRNFSINGNSLWLANGNNSQNDVQLNYTDSNGSVYNAGYYYRHRVDALNQQAYQQITAGFVQPIHQQWRVMGYMQYDLDNELSREWLLGVNYEACCWRASLYGRSYFNDLDDPTAAGIKPKRAIMMEITLKGLAGFSGNLSSLLQQKILGYQQVETLWNER
ncbi:LPS-assembly protein LptD [Alkanindiges sp. WGS2144]|uniref:LPS-assembly protein LptD n=1 Tax=Alkanindiges sp. WGS2144 TaxID=3366808 RepID=UPI0037512106